MNNSNIKSLTAEDIEEYFDVNGDYYDATRMVIQLTSPMKFEEVKQQILDNQEIVQRLKAEYKKSEDDAYTYCRTQDKEYRDKLKSILEKQA